MAIQPNFFYDIKMNHYFIVEYDRVCELLFIVQIEQFFSYIMAGTIYSLMR